MNPHLIDKFKAYYLDPLRHGTSLIDEFYADDLQYEDPFRKIEGVNNFSRFQGKFLAEMKSMSMKCTHQSILHDKAFLAWECELELKRFGKKVQICGMSVLTVTDKIVWQRDYYDAGAFLYEPLPFIGALLLWIKRRKVAGYW